MKTVILIFLTGWISISALMSAAAKDFPSLLGKIESSVRKKQPDWKLIRKDLKENEAIYQWESESKKHRVRLFIFYATSEKEAAEEMRRSIFRISVGPDAKLKELGDEAYIWKDPNRGYGIIRFRKSNVYVDVGASSVTIAEMLAKLIADLVPSR